MKAMVEETFGGSQRGTFPNGERETVPDGSGLQKEDSFQRLFFLSQSGPALLWRKSDMGGGASPFKCKACKVKMESIPKI